MQKLRNHKIIWTSFFTGVYLFVALFSQNFHNHGSGLFFKDFNFKKTEKNFTSSSFAKEFTDCLSCHFASEGNAVLSPLFTQNFIKIGEIKHMIFENQMHVFQNPNFHYTLRGPPVNFI